MPNYVFQLDANKRPLDMIHPARGRKLQAKGKAATFRTYPYAIVHHQGIDSPNTKEYILKIDPGAVWTGFAIQCGEDIIFPIKLKHRGFEIKESLAKRAGFRSSLRSRNVRYRKKRFNRQKPDGWLPPSLSYRLETTRTWIKRFMALCPITPLVVLQLISLTWLASIFARLQLSLTTVDIWLAPVHFLTLSGIVHLSFSLFRSYMVNMTDLFWESVSVFHAT